VTGKSRSAGMALAPPPVDPGVVESCVVESWVVEFCLDDPGLGDLGWEDAPAASGGGPALFERRRSAWARRGDAAGKKE